MDLNNAFQTKQQRVTRQLQEINKIGYEIGLAKNTSNLFRSRQKKKIPRLDFTDFTQVLAIDTKHLTAEVEAATTYKDLVDETLQYGLIPAVVPQFTTITVAGGVSGGACEATAFKYGPAHETVTEMTVLLSSGKVIIATPTNSYRDLFLAMPNTFGSLGYILKLKVKLIPALPYVKLQHVRFTDSKSYFAAIKEMMQTHRYKNEAVDFLDGMILDEKTLYLTIGTFVKEAPYTSDYTYMKIFYQSITKRSIDYLIIRDFIWRWETDWVWGSKNFGMQNKVLRLFFGKFMLNSPTYWKLLGIDRKYHLMDKFNMFRRKREEAMVQDVEIPLKRVTAFLAYFFKTFPLRPIWVCPMISNRQHRFSFCRLDPDAKYINFGFWGVITSKLSLAPNHYNRLLETSIPAYDGYKALYSDSFYSQEEFWKIYDKKLYDQLKKRYDPGNRLKNFYQKVCKQSPERPYET